MRKISFFTFFCLCLNVTLSLASKLDCYDDSRNYPDEEYVTFAKYRTYENLSQDDISRLKEYARKGHVGAIMAYLNTDPDNDEHLVSFVKEAGCHNNESIVMAGMIFLNLYPQYPCISKRKYEMLDSFVADFRGLHILHLMEPKGAYLPRQRAAYAIALLWFTDEARDVLKIENPEVTAIQQFDQWFFETNNGSDESKQELNKFIQLLSMRAMNSRDDPEKMAFYVRAMQKYSPGEEDPDFSDSSDKPEKKSKSLVGFALAAAAIPVIWATHSVLSYFENK